MRGFTIVELLISLVIFSLIMLGTLAAMRTFGESQSRIAQHTAHLDEMRQVSGLLRSLIGKAIPVPVFIKDRGLNTFFTGGEQHLVWVAPMDTGSGNGGVHFFRVSQQEDRLVLQLLPFKSTENPPEWQAVKGHTLLQGVEKIEFGYLPALGNNYEWLDAWNLDYSSPALVRLNIKLNHKHWPEMIVRLDHGQLRR
jgi:prepilin-type N-terminal cleavage/methylation domain-containing protein